jgi:Prenyltransferase and squalene oxidase repeat
MRSNRIRVLVTGVAAIAIGFYAETTYSKDKEPARPEPVSAAVDKGIRWLVSVQGANGGWGQDGGETSYVRQGERLESKGNDVANTAVAAEALLRAGSTPTSGPYRDSLKRAAAFILRRVEQSPAEGLAVTDQSGTQIQRKLGPYIDTFLTSKLLAELDGNMGDAQANTRVRRGLEKCVAKVEKNQLQDGSWNIAGGWAPILGTSLASQSLYLAKNKGVRVEKKTLASVDEYTVRTASAKPISGSAGGVGRGAGREVAAGVMALDVAAVSASVPLYKRAQELEQLSRTEADRQKNAPQIAAIRADLKDARVVSGFGSIGGEEFFSYLNISDSLRRAGGPEWEKWKSDIQAKVLKMQNEDGTWAGHHCITGRVAVTSAAILTLLADREPVLVSSAKKH